MKLKTDIPRHERHLEELNRRTQTGIEPRENVYPVALIGLAISAASAAASAAAQGQANSAVSHQRDAELARQAEFQRKASGVVADSLAQSGRTTADQQIDQGAAKRAADFTRVTTPALPAGQPVTQNRLVASPTSLAAGNAAAQTAAWNSIIGGAQARNGGYADWGLNQAVKNSRAAERLGVIGTNSRNSASVNQLELQDATHAGDAVGNIGQLLGAAGSVMGMYGATQPRVVTTPNAPADFGVGNFEAIRLSDLDLTPAQRLQLQAWR